MRKILLKGYYGFGNFGDDILLKVAYGLLKKLFPESSIDVYSGNTINNPGYSEVPDFNLYIHRLLNEKVKIVDWTSHDSYDLLFNGGGGLYKDHSRGNIMHAAVNSILQRLPPQSINNIEKFLRISINKRQNIQNNRRVGYGISIGPFTKSAPSFLRSYSDIGSYDALFVRDNASFKFLQDHNFQKPYEIVADLAFHTEYWLSDNISRKRNKENNNERARIGIILLDWHENNDIYFCNIKESASMLEKEGYEVCFFSFQKHFDQKFINYFEGQVTTWDPVSFNLRDFLDQLIKMSIIISARAHGAIVAACLGIPSICLGITLKLREVHKMLACSSRLIEPPFCASDITKKVFEIQNNYTRVISSLDEDLTKNKEIAKKSENLLRNMLLQDAAK